MLPWASILLHGPLDICLDSAARSSATAHAKTGRTANAFTAQGNTCRISDLDGGNFSDRVLVETKFGGSETVTLYLVFGEGVKSARAATAILAATTTLETCFERPLVRSYWKRTIALESAEIMQ